MSLTEEGNDHTSDRTRDLLIHLSAGNSADRLCPGETLRSASARLPTVLMPAPTPRATELISAGC